jgi:hypothetical protein
MTVHRLGPISVTVGGPLHQDYIDEAADLIEALGFDVDAERAGVATDGELDAVLEFTGDDGTAWTVAWGEVDGWIYTTSCGPDGFSELCAGLTPPPALVAAAIHLLLIGATDCLPLADDPDRPAPVWDGQAAFEEALGRWLDANPTTPDGEQP